MYLPFGQSFKLHCCQFCPWHSKPPFCGLVLICLNWTPGPHVVLQESHGDQLQWTVNNEFIITIFYNMIKVSMYLPAKGQSPSWTAWYLSFVFSLYHIELFILLQNSLSIPWEVAIVSLTEIGQNLSAGYLILIWIS